jgi:hypothetical protein
MPPQSSDFACLSAGSVEARKTPESVLQDFGLFELNPIRVYRRSTRVARSGMIGAPDGAVSGPRALTDMPAASAEHPRIAGHVPERSFTTASSLTRAFSPPIATALGPMPSLPLSLQPIATRAANSGAAPMRSPAGPQELAVMLSLPEFFTYTGQPTSATRGRKLKFH